MKTLKTFLILIFILFSVTTANADSIERTWPFTSLTGGGSGSLDGAVSGVSINPDDQAFGTHVTSGNTIWYHYRVELSGLDESGFDIIKPDDVGAGTTRWHLVTNSGRGRNNLLTNPDFGTWSNSDGVYPKLDSFVSGYVEAIRSDVEG